MLIEIQIQAIVSCFPKVSNLSLRSNDLESVGSQLKSPNLKSLDLSQNFIKTLDDVSMLSQLSHLSSLNLSYNPIETLRTSHHLTFPSLQKLSLAGTNVLDITELAHFFETFPNLTHLVLAQTPLVAKLVSPRLMTIGRIGTLMNLNHSEISREERQNAELYYLGTIIDEIKAAQPGTSRAKILDKHPRFQQLWEAHDRPSIPDIQALAVTAKSTTMASRILSLTFHMNKALLDTIQDLPKPNIDPGYDEVALSHQALVHRLGSSPNPRVSQIIESVQQRLTPSPIAIAQHNTPSPTEASHSNTIVSLIASIPPSMSLSHLTFHVARLFRLPGPFPGLLRLIHETDEWDPIVTKNSGEGTVMTHWDNPVNDSEDREAAEGDGEAEEWPEGQRMRPDMQRREIEFPPVSHRCVGDFIDGGGSNGDHAGVGKQARIRVEIWGVRVGSRA